MTLTSPGTRKHRLAIVAIAATLASMQHVEAAAPEPPPGLTHYRCYICHSDREPLVGPAFEDVAKAYRNKTDAVSKIAADIRAGIRSGGPWHMPPHPEISPAEAKAMARYIMSLQPKGAVPQHVDRH